MLYTAARVVSLGLAAFVVPADAFTAVATPRTAVPLRASPLYLSELQTEQQDCGCAEEVAGVVTPTNGVMMNSVRVTGATLRGTELVNSRGTPTTVGSVIGEDGKAVVIFLRHLG